VSSETVQLARHLAETVPALKDLLTEHLDDNDGDLLPHVYFGDLTRWVSAELSTDPDSPAVRKVLAELDDAAANGSDDVVELVTVSFLENLDDDSPVLDLLSPHLVAMRAELFADDDA
jgi:hypothetical protein